MARIFLVPIETVVGSDSAPGITVAGDSNTGIRGGGDDTLRIITTGAERLRVDSTGKLLVGDTTARNTGLGFPPDHQFVGVGAAEGSALLLTYLNVGSGPVFCLAHSRSGAVGSFAVLTDGDEVGKIEFAGADGTKLVSSAIIVTEVDGTPGTDDMPGRLMFKTTADGSATPTERMRIDSKGNVIVNTSSVATTATDGFLYTSSCAGPPTGVPTSYGGRMPIVVDTTNNKFYFYSSSAWHEAGSGGFVLKIGDTMTGSLTMNTAGGTNAVLSETGIDRASGSAETFNIQNSGASTMELQVDGAKVMHTGNDGAGSTFDADLLDGVNGTSYARVDAATNFTTVPTISSTGIALQGKHSFFIPAKSFKTRVTNGAAAGTEETATNRLNFDYFDFDATTQEFIQTDINMPKHWNLGTITYEIWWKPVAGSALQNVVWAVNGICISDDDPIEVAFGAAVDVADAHIATGDMHKTTESGAVTIGGTPATGDWLKLQVARDPAETTPTADNMTGDARFMGIRIFYTADKGNDA